MRGFDRIRVSCAVVLTLLVSCTPPNSKNPAQPVGDEFDFIGTAWVLASLGGRPILGDANVTLEFGDESFDGYSGCNWYGGNYTVTDAAINFADIASTARACATPAGVMQQEEVYGQALYEATAYRVVGDRLELRDGAGTVTLAFTRGGETPEP